MCVCVFQEVQLSKVENEVAALALEVSEVVLRIEALSRLQTELQQDVMKRNQLVSASEAAVDKLLLTVNHKQSAINVCNKKIEQIRAKTGVSNATVHTQHTLHKLNTHHTHHIFVTWYRGQVSFTETQYTNHTSFAMTHRPRHIY